MAKPTIAAARWATASANITAPSSGQRDDGIVAGAASVSSYINYLLNQIYLWLVYINAGLWEGDQSIDGTLTVSSETAGKGEIIGDHFVCTDGSYAHGELPRNYPAACGHFVVGTGSYQLAGKVQNAATSDVFEIPVALDVTEDIVNAGARIDPAASGVVTMDVVRVSTGATIASVSTSGAALQDIAVDCAGAGTTGPYVLRFTFTLATGHSLIHAVTTVEVLPSVNA